MPWNLGLLISRRLTTCTRRLTHVTDQIIRKCIVFHCQKQEETLNGKLLVYSVIIYVHIQMITNNLTLTRSVNISYYFQYNVMSLLWSHVGTSEILRVKSIWYIIQLWFEKYNHILLQPTSLLLISNSSDISDSSNCAPSTWVQLIARTSCHQPPIISELSCTLCSASDFRDGIFSGVDAMRRTKSLWEGN